MNNYKNIVEKYPELFEFKEGSQEPFPLFGFECGIGWYNIIDNACKVIYSDYRRLKQNLKYAKDQEQALKELEQAKDNLPKVVQAKEKYGTLRFYLDNGYKAAYKVASFAEYMSETTCEKCGNSGETYTIGWHRTLCEEHAIEQYGEEKIKEYSEK
jgi:hypothetical protein